MAYNNVRRDPGAFQLATMKPPVVHTEIQKAVRDYVDSLISERSAAGRGMAASSNDLMLAARAASIKINTQDVSRSYLKPAVQLISDQLTIDNDRASQYSSRTPRKPTGAKPVKKPAQEKREPHWLTWKTGRTPMPHEEPRAPSARPDTAMMTPAPPVGSPDLDILDLTGYPGRAPSRVQTPAHHMICTPVPQRVNTPAEHRINTPAPQRVNTPASMIANHRDFLADRQVAPAEIALKPRTPQNPAYMPALKAWVTNANDYERDVAFSLMQVLSTGSSPVARNRARPRTAVPGLNKMSTGPKRHIPKTAGVRTSVPAYWQQIYQDPRHEQYVVNGMAKALRRKEPDFGLAPAPAQCQPTRQVCLAPQVNTAHQASCFMDSHKPYRGSYIINPEWVSEMDSAPKHPV